MPQFLSLNTSRPKPPRGGPHVSRVLTRPVRNPWGQVTPSLFVSLENDVKTETKVACFVLGLLGAFAGILGVFAALSGDFFWGFALFIVGFAVEVLALKTYVEEITK